jgi:Na+/H+-dicarboxylate symporter
MRYLIAICAGAICEISQIGILISIGQCCAEVFSRILRCVSLPIIFLSVVVALSSYSSDNKSMMKILRKSWKYSLITTIIAATVAAILYIIISPKNAMGIGAETPTLPATYSRIVMDIVPDSILGSFIGNKVLSVLLISAVIGISIGFISDVNAKNTIILFFKGLQSIFFTIIKFIVKLIPVGLFGFVITGLQEFKAGSSLLGMGKYFSVVVLANVVQGVIVLPLFLMLKGIKPFRALKSMMPALSVAFFSKSSNATLPIAISTIEKELGVSQRVSRFVLPLCTTINMNACAGFIFTTSIYMMQNHGMEITAFTIVSWILIATLAAIGNAGVPMGCYFMTMSLLMAIDVPAPLMGIILPIYNLIDMLETAINVWSDSCVAAVVDVEVKREE